MWNNIGGKIKLLAKIVCFVSIALFVIGAIILFVYAAKLEDDSLTILFTTAGILTLLLGPLFSWVGSFILYGYGELISTNKQVADNFGTSPLDRD